MVCVEGPKIDRSLHLNFQGDWGQANFHMILGWLMQELGDRTGSQSRTAVWNGDGGASAARAVGSGAMDLAISTPARLAVNALEGTGLLLGEPIPGLRAIGVLPQNDRLVIAVRQELGICTFEDLRRVKPALKVAISADDGSNHIGFLSHRLMDAAGAGKREVESWGGRYYQAARPDSVLSWLHNKEVDAVVQEAIMTPWWHEMLEDQPLHYLPVEESVLTYLEESYHCRRGLLPKNYFKDLDRELSTLDFSDFILLVRDDMPDDVAHLLAWCLTETRGTIEARFRHIAPERSPLSYPLEPKKMAKTPIPLHPGAKRHYENYGYL
ncbi:hypothetical protein HBA55_02115 [Pseudomaricurvus alkylphenolicus]|uniref:TAXI family TRAP transporter solute-binding subunit n=1 Tax=Pseudomaricurvus alkylphenolicus TaxID=1306991 RepID=UPI0014249FF3|nr:TAXI family TRAP transporter solute-binding subunit [Pseudomaricurvus alkylphenolicus]NIB38360.1 hypothetical protein [Pseudomaricurvus alkylphenolicus]